jgi:predicted alpha/beta-fold hydrolase
MDAVFKNGQDKKLVCYFDVPKIAKTKNPTVLIVHGFKGDSLNTLQNSILHT